MDIQQAIEHAREVAKCKRAEATYNFPTLVEYYNECKKCADEHEQLAEWLEELRNRRKLGTLNVVTCEDCKYSVLPAKLTQIYGKPGTLTCRNKNGCPCNGRNVRSEDFCSYGKRKEG